jgi:hypothetical protein
MLSYSYNRFGWLWQFSFMTLISIGYGEDSTTVVSQDMPTDTPSIVRIDTVKEIDTVVIMHKEIILEKKVYENPYTERNRIKYLKAEADSLRREYLITNKASILIKSDSINHAFINDLKEWQSDYPVAAKIERSKRILIGTGVSQIITGGLGIILTIVHAAGKTKFSYKEPIYSNSGVKTGETTKSFSVDNEWTAFHTMAFFLSTGFIVSGIITVNF